MLYNNLLIAFESVVLKVFDLMSSLVFRLTITQII